MRREVLGRVGIGEAHADDGIALVLAEEVLGRLDRQEDDVAVIALIADVEDRRRP